MATRANILYQIRLRRQIIRSGQTTHMIARMTGIPQPVIHRFIKEERGINTDTAEKLAAYLEMRTDETHKVSVTLDLLQYYLKMLRWLEQQIRECPEEERPILIKHRDEVLLPSIDDFERVVYKMFPELASKIEVDPTQELSRRDVSKQRRSTRNAKEGD